MAEERVQRRLAAILAADVVGYSRLVRVDEAGTLAQLKVLRKEVFDPRIAEHNGRIVKTMGDGVLVEFPIQIALGDGQSEQLEYEIMTTGLGWVTPEPQERGRGMSCSTNSFCRLAL